MFAKFELIKKELISNFNFSAAAKRRHNTQHKDIQLNDTA
jgi:hypothetical protein